LSDRIFNLLELELSVDEDAPPGHRFGDRSVTGQVGAAATGMSVYGLEPGQATWPYHFEFVNEEWLIVIHGELTLRTPDGERVLRAGDVAAFRAGASGAHAVRNHGNAPARFAMPSTQSSYGDATIYPDAGTFAIGGPASLGFYHRGYLGEVIEYWEGQS
jgi:uncharacterized cupin superfamily protein